MKRLTIRNSDGSVSQPTSTTIKAVFEKLADYEDLEEQGRITALPDKVNDFDFMRAFELIFADNEGRVALLPCKVGDTVYQIDNYGNMYDDVVKRIVIENSKVIYETNGIGFDETAIGERVFLSREEAVEAWNRRV